MITHFKCDLCHFLNMNVRYPTKLSQEDDRLMIAICWESLEKFWSRESGTMRGKLTILRKMRTMAKEELALDYWFPPLGT